MTTTTESYLPPPRHVDFTIIPPSLGTGSFGTVWKAINTIDKCHYAIKQICIAKVLPHFGNNLDSIFHEVRSLQAINHPHVVRYHTCWLDGPNCDSIKNGSLTFPENASSTNKFLPLLPANNFLLIQMELCEITLKQVLKSDPMTLTASDLFPQLSRGLKVIHENNVVHRDLKPDNIFRSKNTWKIGDFGYARVYEENEEDMSIAGCRKYRSPDEGCSQKSDIYSLGIMFVEVLERISGEKGIFRVSQVNEILGRMEERFKPECEIIGEMILADKEARLSAEKVCSKFGKLYDKPSSNPDNNKPVNSTGESRASQTNNLIVKNEAPDVKSVAQILSTDANLCTGSNYLSLCGPLGVRYIDYAPYQQAVENENMTRLGFLETILLLWVTRCVDAATIEALVEVLLQAKFASLAEKLKSNFVLTNKINSGIKPASNGLFTPVRFGLSKSLLNFVGRKSELTELTTLLKTNKLVIVTGLRGVGKTEFCRHYADLFCTREQGNCLWFHGQSDATLVSSLAQLAAQLKIPINPKNSNSLSYIFPLLSNLSFFSKTTLIVLDNVDNSAQTQLVFKFITELKNVSLPLVTIRILVTSFDNMTLQSLSGEHFRLLPMSVQDATKLVRQSLGQKTPDQDVHQLLQEFQNFPLHLQQAVHYIKDKSYMLCGGFGVRDYLKLCRRQTVPIESWDVNIDAIRRNRENGDLAMKLLILLAYLDPSGVKDELLFLLVQEVDTMASFDSDELGYHIIFETITARKQQAMPVEFFESTTKAKNALDLLHRYLLVQCADSVLTMHRLVQDAVRRKVHNREIYYGPPPPENLPLDSCNHLDFLRKLTGYLARKTLADGSLKVRPELIHFYYTWEFANAGNSLEEELKPLPMFICHTVLNVCSTSVQNPATFSTFDSTQFRTPPVRDAILQKQSQISAALQDRQNFTEFISVIELTYNASKIVMEADDVNPVVIGFLTAICLHHVGKPVQASRLRTEILKLSTTIFSKQDKSFPAKKKAGSLWIFEDILNWRCHQGVALSILEKQAPETQNLDHNLGFCLLAIGRFVEAKMTLKIAATWKCDNLEGGDLHPSTLNTKRLLFYCMTQIREDRVLGIEQLEKVAGQYAGIFGQDHILVKGTKKVLGVVKEGEFRPSREGGDGLDETGGNNDKSYCPCSIV